MYTNGDIDAAAKALKAGQLAAFPTETVYGLGADACNDAAVARVFEAKARPSFNPLITHVADTYQAFRLGFFSDEARILAEAFWPGPLTLVVPRRDDCPVSMLASAGLPSIAIRVPAHAAAYALLQRFGGPVVAPSANPSGQLSPTTAEHVRRGLGGKVAAIVDGGPCPIGLESSIVGFMHPRPTLLRPGGISREEIEKQLGRHVAREIDTMTPSSPGQLASHYAPKAKLRLNASAPVNGEAFLAFGPGYGEAMNLSQRGDLTEAAANLFRMLHELDDGVDSIAVASIPSHGLGEAINDRLARAAGPRP